VLGWPPLIWDRATRDQRPATGRDLAILCRTNRHQGKAPGGGHGARLVIPLLLAQAGNPVTGSRGLGGFHVINIAAMDIFSLLRYLTE
jgi:hypothetical protein